MSFVIAAPEPVQDAARDLTGIGSSLAEATASVSGSTTAIAAAAQDEVSVAIASLFGNFGQEFHALGAQAQAFHAQFVGSLNSGAGAYVSAEEANAQSLMDGVPPPTSAGLDDGDQCSDGVRRLRAVPEHSVARHLHRVRPAHYQSRGVFQEPRDRAAVRDIDRHAPEHCVGRGEPHPWWYHDFLRRRRRPTPVPDAHLEIYEGLVGAGDFDAPSGLEGCCCRGLPISPRHL